MRGQLTEFGTADLRFTVEEAAVFLKQTMGLELDETAVATLENRTEGWVAALQLAALSLRGSEDSGRFIADFGGSNRHVADYLLEEVLSRQPPDIQTFLQQTAILERFCGPLCDAVTGTDAADGQMSPSAAVLEQLEHSNLFLIPLDAHRRWYRYHHLFAGLLQDRLLRQAGQARANDLHRRASRWFAAEGLLEEAVHHAAQAQDYEEAARLIATIQSGQLWEQSNIGLLRKWGSVIPDAVYHKVPRAAMVVSAAEMITGDFQNLYHHLDLIANVESVRGEYLLFQAILVRNQGDYIKALHLAREAGEFLDENDVETRAMALMQMAVIMFEIGELSEARKTLLFAREILESKKSSGFNMILQLDQMVILFHLEQIDFEGARRVILEEIALAEKGRNRPSPVTGILLATLGDIYYEWNQLEKAAEYYAQSHQWAERTGISDIIIPTLLGEIKLLCQRGEMEAVRPKLRQFRSLTNQSRMDNIVNQTEMIIAFFYLRLGQLDKAVQWTNKSGLNIIDRPDYSRRYYYMRLIAIRLAEYRASGSQDQIPQLLGLLDHFITVSQQAGYQHTTVELLILRAMALDIARDHIAAVQNLQKAIDMAQPGRMVRLFIDYGPALAPLLAACKGDYARLLHEALLADMRIQGLETAESESSPPLDLTPREFDVLQAIIAGLSNKEIEEKLVISHNTVRTHIKNLYNKLDVTSRTQAIKKAHDLGLLP